MPRHPITAHREDKAVGETVAELECLDRHLPCDSCEVSERNHDWHDCHGLSEPGGNEEVYDDVGEEHEVCTYDRTKF